MGPTSAPDAPTKDPVAHAKPNLRTKRAQNKLRNVGGQLGSSWAQVGANWPKFPNFRPRRPSLTPGWAKYARFFPLCPVPWVRAVFVAIRIPMHNATCPYAPGNKTPFSAILGEHKALGGPSCRGNSDPDEIPPLQLTSAHISSQLLVGLAA